MRVVGRFGRVVAAARAVAAATAAALSLSGRKPLDDRLGILFVLQTGIGWEHLPQELGCCLICWRRLENSLH